MTDEPDTMRNRASKEATDWLILLQEEPGNADLRRRFDAWLNKDPLHKAAWAATRRVANAIEASPAAYAERWEPFVSGTPEGNAKPKTTPPPQPAAARRQRARPSQWLPGRLQIMALAVTACLAVLFGPELLLQMQADYMTGTGETRELRFEDGSMVVLAPDSSIAVAYGKDKRRFSLLAGEAFFEAAPDPERPLEVLAEDVRATVIGTAFNLRREEAGVTIALQHGGLRVDHRAASPPILELLEAGQSVHVGWAGDVVRGNKPPALIAAWRNGRLIVEDQPLGVVVDRLRPYFGGTIILADRTLKGRPVTGVYNLTNPVDALRGIAQAHGAAVRQITPWVLIVSGS